MFEKLIIIFIILLYIFSIIIKYFNFVKKYIFCKNLEFTSYFVNLLIKNFFLHKLKYKLIHNFHQTFFVIFQLE